MIAGMRAGDPAGNVRDAEQYVRIDPVVNGQRLLSWIPERSTGVFYHVLMDGYARYRSAVTEQAIKPGDTNPRSVIDVLETSIQNEREFLLHVTLTPTNRVRSFWAPVDGATTYTLYRKLSSGSYGSPIYTTSEALDEYEYLDRDLPDGDYVYKLVSADAEGDSTEDEEPITISTVPEAPTNIAGSWNPTTHVFTITWTGSGSSDLDHYAIRHNGGSGSVRLDDAPEDTSAIASWSIDLTGLTGDYEFLIRAVDGDSNEEQNISQMIAIAVVAGVAQGRPAAPDYVKAEPISGGKARVSFAYFPSRESGFASAAVAKEARVYSDNGTGVMDWVTPVGTVLMDNPTDPDRWSFDTGVLADDTYLFAVRIATDTGGGGTETTNEDTYAVTTNDSVPSATDLSVENG